MNPVMPGDFSDLDAIRVGRDFYAISSTFQYSPGVAVLHSSDLVNWEFIGHVVSDLTSIDRDLNWDRMARSGRGIWAGAIRYHAGKYWVYIGTPDQGFFMSTAFDPRGPWTAAKQVLRAAGWDDPCPFWDDDGQGYLVGTHFEPEQPAGTTYNIHLFKMNASGDQLLTTTDQIIHRSTGSEANKLYKVRNLYYHYFSEVLPEGRAGMIERANSLNGPWEIRQLQHVDKHVDKEPNQGGIVELANGSWYFVSHQGTGDWEGRAGVLLPITWIDGWPIIGKPGEDGMGNMVWRAKKPILGYGFTSLVANDDFKEKHLKPNWEWNYQPRADHWHLDSQRGSLRLYAFEPLHDGSFETVGNVLTQRAMRTSDNRTTAKLNLAGMANGGEAGLVHYAETTCALGVRQKGAARILVFNKNGKNLIGPAIKTKTIWIRSTWDFDGRSTFSYSLDGKVFISFGPTYQLTWGHYRGDRVGIYTYGHSGYVDFESFQYKITRNAQQEAAARANLATKISP